MKSFVLTGLILAAALTTLAMSSTAARAQTVGEVEAARANARAGGAVGAHDRDLLATYGALSGTRQARSRLSRASSSSRTANSLRSPRRSRDARMETASRESGSGKSRKSSRVLAEKNIARPPDSDVAEGGGPVEIARDPCDDASGNVPSPCREFAENSVPASPPQSAPEAAGSTLAETAAAAETLRMDSRIGQPLTLVRSLSGIRQVR